MRTLKTFAAVVIASAILTMPAIAGADLVDQTHNSGSASGTSDGGAVEASHHYTLESSGPTGGQSGFAACVTNVYGGAIAQVTASSWNAQLPPAPSGVTATADDQYAFVVCSPTGANRSSLTAVYRVGDPPPVQQLVEQARDQLVVPLPVPVLAPSADVPHLVGMTDHLGLDPASTQPLTASAAVPGVTVTLTATPATSIWDPGDGTTPFTCATDATCSYMYQRSSTRTDPAGTYTATVTTTWDLDWTCTPGCGTGTLPTVGRTTTYDLLVRQGQAIITGPPS